MDKPLGFEKALRASHFGLIPTARAIELHKFSHCCRIVESPIMKMVSSRCLEMILATRSSEVGGSTKPWCSAVHGSGHCIGGMLSDTAAAAAMLFRRSRLHELAMTKRMSWLHKLAMTKLHMLVQTKRRRTYVSEREDAREQILKFQTSRGLGAISLASWRVHRRIRTAAATLFFNRIKK